MPRASERRLKSAEDVRRALAWLWRQVESDRIDEKKARVMIYAASTLAVLIRDTDLEARLEALEAAQKGEA